MGGDDDGALLDVEPQAGRRPSAVAASPPRKTSRRRRSRRKIDIDTDGSARVRTATTVTGVAARLSQGVTV